MRWVLLTIIVFNNGAAFPQSQKKLHASFCFFLRDQSISTIDNGGYFISDQYTSRINYGIGAEYDFTKRWTGIIGLQRISFIRDVNFWFLNSGYVLLTKGNPYTGVSLPIGLKFNLINTDSKYKWRVGVLGDYRYNKVNAEQGGVSYGITTNQPRTIVIDYFSSRDVTRGSFHTFGYGIFAKYRLSKKLWTTYDYSNLKSLTGQVVINDIEYNVTRDNITNNYTAKTVADGSARHHAIGILFTF